MLASIERLRERKGVSEADYPPTTTRADALRLTGLLSQLPDKPLA